MINREAMKNREEYGKLLSELSDLVSKGPTVVAIDGRCGSGKSTLGEMLSAEFNCRIVHGDDFFLPPEKRVEQRLSEPGGNFDYERFQEQVIEGIKGGGKFSYHVFSCKEMRFVREEEVRPYKLLVVEGAYVLHPYLEDVYDVKVFVDITKEEQEQGIVERNGEDGWKIFESKWIPMEERYFESFQIKEKCDFLL